MPYTIIETIVGLIQAIDELREHAEVAANRRLEVAIMIRPRSGNFVYNEVGCG